MGLKLLNNPMKRLKSKRRSVMPPTIQPESTFDAVLDMRLAELQQQIAEVEGPSQQPLLLRTRGCSAPGRSQRRPEPPAMTSVKNELRPYQEEIGRAILDSVDKRKGLTFSVMIARQGGKNEISAQVEATVLTAWAKVGGSAVKAAPTFSPQARISISRLKDLLDGAGGPSSYEFDLGYIFRLGRARQIFLSAHPASNVVGATADLPS